MVRYVAVCSYVVNGHTEIIKRVNNKRSVKENRSSLLICSEYVIIEKLVDRQKHRDH